MMKQIAAIIAMLCVCLGAAKAQDKPEIFSQLGHSQSGAMASEVFSGGAESVAFSPDGHLLASGSRDQTVKLWEVASGRELRTLSGHTNHVRSVAFSPDGRLLASGSEDHTIKLWDVATGRELSTLSGHSDRVDSIAFSPDGRLLASASGDHTVKLWEVASGRELRTLSGHSDSVTSVAFSPDGRLLASGSGDHTVKLWEVASGRELRTLSGHADWVYSVAFSPDGRLLASGSHDNTIKLWDVGSGRELRTLSGHSDDQLSSVAFSPDGRMLASAGGNGTGIFKAGFVNLWDVASGHKLRTLRGGLFVLSVTFSPDGRMLASGSDDKTIKLWDVASGHELRTLSGRSSGVDSIAFSPDGRMLASGSGDHTVKLWDVAAGRELRAFREDSSEVLSVAFSPNGQILAAGGRDNTIKLWDVASGRELRSLSGHSGFVDCVAFSPDGRILASGGRGNTVKLWDVATGRELRTFRVDTNWVTSVTFSPDGQILASGGGDAVRLWDVASGRELHTLRRHFGLILSVAFSPDGHMLASANEDHTVTLWEVASGRELRTLSGHSGSVSSVAFAPDGQWIATGSADGTVRIWDLSSGRQRVSLIAFTDGSYLAITPEGYYDASSEQAEDNLNVRLGNRVFPIAAYRDKFYRPDLVRLSLAGRSLKELGFAGIDSVKVAPTVELIDLPASTNDPKLTVNVRITDGGGGIGQVRLYLNGTAVVQDSVTTASASHVGGPLTRSYTVQLADGPNGLQAEAYNADNSMNSSSALARIAANLPPATRANLHAVVVGIQEFRNPSYNLTYPVKDAQLFADTLKKYSAPLFQHVDIKLLTAPNETTRDSLMQALKDIKATAGPGDLFVFYVASHGVTDEGEYYLITANVASASTEHLKRDAVSKEELIALVANIPATKKLMVIDTCHAEALGSALQIGLMTRGLDEATALKILSRAVGTTVLAASTSTQQALEGYEGHGLFTYVVAEGLMGKGNADENGFVTTLGLATYVDVQVPVLAQRQFNHTQNPTVETNGQGFPLTKVR